MPKKDIAGEIGFKQLENFIISSGEIAPDEHIPTGHFCLDFAINYGYDPTKTNLSEVEGYSPSSALGLPVGKIVELFGEEGGGKSSLAYRIVGNAQKMGYSAAWIDAECSFSRSLAKINGCDTDKLLLVDTGLNDLNAEEVLKMIHLLATSDKVPQTGADGKKTYIDRPKVIVLDSLASLVPKVIDEGAFDQQYIGILARLLSMQIGRIAKAVSANKVLLIIINQLREKIGMMYGDPSTSPGGHAIKHFFSVRLKMTKKKSKEGEIVKLDSEGEESVIGRHTYVKIEKNRFGRPVFEAIEVPIYYEAYFPNIEDIVFDAGRQFKIISVRKGIFLWGDIREEGKANFIKKIKGDGLTMQLIQEIKKTALENGAIVPPEIHLYDREEVKHEPEMEGQVPGDGEGEDSGSSEEGTPKRRKGKKGS